MFLKRVGRYAGFCPDCSVTAIPLGLTLPQASSSLPGNSASSLTVSLLGLAPSEVYLADRITTITGGLLHHPFTLTPRQAVWRSTLCCTCSRVTPGGRYPPLCSVEPGRSSTPLPVPQPSSRPASRSSILLDSRGFFRVAIETSTAPPSPAPPQRAAGLECVRWPQCVRTKECPLSRHSFTSASARLFCSRGTQTKRCLVSFSR